MTQPGQPLCPICGQSGSVVPWGSRAGFDVTRCRGCGVGRTIIPADFDLRAIYSEAYFRGQRGDGYADYVGSADIVRAESRRSLRALAAVGRTDGQLLEIGCAYGFFLDVVPSSFRAFGIEVCEDAAKACRSRGLDVVAGTLTEELLRERRPIDVAVMLDVIEHLSDPLETLRLVSKSMSPGAHLMLTTGDWGSGLAKVMGTRWRLMTPPQHLFFFTARSLEVALRRTGFKIIELTHPSKQVSLGLAAYQIQRLLGLNPRPIRQLSRLSMPINLHDAFRMIAVRVC